MGSTDSKFNESIKKIQANNKRMEDGDGQAIRDAIRKRIDERTERLDAYASLKKATEDKATANNATEDKAIIGDLRPKNKAFTNKSSMNDTDKASQKELPNKSSTINIDFHFRLNM